MANSILGRALFAALRFWAGAPLGVAAVGFDLSKRSHVAVPGNWNGQAKVVEAKAPVCYICFMKRDEAISRLQQHEAELKRLGVEHLYMFGSTARGEAGDDSDVDLFFDHEKGKLGLFELMDVKERAASILGGKTDIMTRNSLHPRLRKRIEEAAVLIF